MANMSKAKIIKEDPLKVIIPFGQYEGEYLGDIPDDYLTWLISQKGFKENRPRLAKQIKIVLENSEPNDKNFTTLDDDDFSGGF